MKQWLTLVIICLLAACQDGRYDKNDAVPKGDPPFTPLGDSWVIDKADVLSGDARREASNICEQMRRTGLAEMVILIQTGIKHPMEYSTHYGRWLGLGKKGLSTEGGNNGIVWLIRPDADDRLTISVGRGLPELTAVDYNQIMQKAKDYINFNNFDQGVLEIARSTYEKLIEINKEKQK